MTEHLKAGGLNNPITINLQWGANIWAPLVEMSVTINLYVSESKPQL